MELVNKLIEIASFSGQELEIQKFIFNWFKSIGLEPIWVGENLVVKINGQNSNQALIFNAHVDTVGVGELSAWHTDPFKGEVKDGKIYGLGASDEKAGVASLMLLGQKLIKQPPSCDVFLTFVVKEELDGSGTEEFLKWFLQIYHYQTLGAILVEPTSLKEVQIASKGNVFVNITVKGQSGHGSQPDKITKNSVVIASEVIQKLTLLQTEWQKIYSDPILGSPTIGIGTSIQAGASNSPNKFPASCQLTLDIRTTPKLHSQVLSLLEQYLKGFPVQISYLFQPVPFGLTERADSLVKAVLEANSQLEIASAPWSSDQPFFTAQKIPSLILGPGEKSVMHGENEWCQSSNIDQAVELYYQVISHWSER